MGKFKRFCMIVFVVAAVLGIGVLAALWFAWEPLFPAIAWLMSMPWFFVVEAVLLGIPSLVRQSRAAESEDRANKATQYQNLIMS